MKKGVGVGPSPWDESRDKGERGGGAMREAVRVGV